MTARNERPALVRTAQVAVTIVLAAAVALTALTVASVVWGMATGNHFQAYSVPVEWSAEELESPVAIVDGVSVRGIEVPIEGTVSVDFGRGWSDWLALEALAWLISGGAAAAVAWMLLRLLRDTRQGRALTDVNARRITRIGVIVAAAPILVSVAHALQPVIVEGGDVVTAALSIEIFVNPLVAGILLVVLGSVWAHAATIEAEQQLTV